MRKETHSTTSLADAFCQTSAGTSLIVQIKNAPSDRKRELRRLAYDTLVGRLVPRHQTKSWEAFNGMSIRILELGYKGGSEYDKAVNLLKHCWTSRQAYEECIAFMSRQRQMA